MSTLVRELNISATVTSALPVSIRWAAPELFAGEGTKKTTLFSDVYSFGSVALQIYTGKRPYAYVETDQQVLIHRLTKENIPKRSSDIQDSHWDVLRKCWDTNPKSRPSSESVIKFFAGEAGEERQAINKT